MTTTARPTPKVADPNVQAVFDALDNYIAASGFVTANASVTYDGSGTTHTMNCNDRNSQNSYTYTERTAGTRVSITPLSTSLGPGQTQQFTATAADADGNTIVGASFDWSLQGGALGKVDANGLYAAPATVAGPAFDTLTCSLSGQNSWASVTVQLHA
jgi:hypothetical protein